MWLDRKCKTTSMLGYAFTTSLRTSLPWQIGKCPNSKTSMERHSEKLQIVRLLSHADFDRFWWHSEDCLRPFFLLPTLVEWPAPSLVSSCVFGPSTGAALGQLNLPLWWLNHRSVEFSGSVKAPRWNIARATELMEVNSVAEFWLLIASWKKAGLM